MPNASRWPQARMAVATPTHQFPMRARVTLARRVAPLETEGARQLPPSLQGMYLAHEMSQQLDDRSFSLKAAAAGVNSAPLSNHCMPARRRGWLFGYAGFNEADIGAARLTQRPGALAALTPFQWRAIPKMNDSTAIVRGCDESKRPVTYACSR
jgi:DNA-binding transcriptional MocR family regulator